MAVFRNFKRILFGALFALSAVFLSNGSFAAVPISGGDYQCSGDETTICDAGEHKILCLPGGGYACEKCPVGQYSTEPTTAVSLCSKCPTGYTTANEGSTSANDCSVPITYTINFESNGGLIFKPSVTATYDASADIGSAPTRDGYTFTGWEVSGMSSGETH